MPFLYKHFHKLHHTYKQVFMETQHKVGQNWFSVPKIGKSVSIYPPYNYKLNKYMTVTQGRLKKE